MKTAIALIPLLFATAAPCAPATAPVSPSQVRELTVYAAAAPQRALRYRLVPSVSEQTRGNAAPLYLMAFLQTSLTEAERKTLDELKQAKADSFPIDKAKQLLAARKSYFDTLALAARRDDCHWEIPIREQGVATLLPHLQPCRLATELLCLQARVQMAEGHFDEAVASLQIGFALVEHLKNDAVLVQGLVAMSMATTLLEEVIRMEQTPGGPNLYWALAALPRPVFDLRAMGEAEQLWSNWLMPQLKDRKAADLTAADFREILQRIGDLTVNVGAAPPRIGDQLQMVVVLAQALGSARHWLLAHGFNQKQVDQMPPVQAVGIYFVEVYQQTGDEMLKWLSLPYWQARQGLADADHHLRSEDGQNHNPLLTMMPALAKVSLRVAQAERRIALDQTVEALRAYAAGHEGKFPKSLADLSEMPAPIDPVTGRSFDYEASGATAILSSIGPVGHAEETQIYRIHLAQR